MSVATTVSSETPDLLSRLSRAGDLPEALSILIDSVIVAHGIGRVVVLVDDDGELRGTTGIGWEQQQILQLSIPRAHLTHPVVRALNSPEVSLIEGGGVLDLERCGVLPLLEAEARDPALGVLLFDPGAGSADHFQGVARSVFPAVPLLRRLSELDNLRSSSRELEHQRDLLTTIINSLPDPALITDPENTVILENRRAEMLLTSRAEDSEGRRRAIEINNLLLSSFLTRSVIGGPDPSGRELNLVDPSEGEDLLFEVLSTPLSSPEGGGMTISVLRDVTDLKQASAELERQFKRARQTEQEARRERDRLNLVLENVGDPILVTDEESNIILLNREAERLFDVPPGTQLEGRRRQEVRANDTKFTSVISDFALSADSVRAVEVALVDPENGEEFPAEVVSGKVMNDRGEMAAIVSIVHDRTKVVENERMASELARLNEGLEERIREATEVLAERNHQLECQQRELARAYQLKSQFLASMSHELRTPINALLGYTSLMRDRLYGAITPKQENALERMQVASHHLLALVNDVLDLAKIEAGKMPVHTEVVDLSALVDEIAQTIEPMAHKKTLQLDFDVCPDVPMVQTDLTKVRQVLLNLLSNAVKFTHEGGVRVRVERGRVAETVKITVSDTGIGIAEEELPHVFDDFRQVDQSPTREYGGTGLGLSITKKLLHLLGGSIQVESRVGEGTTFTAFLPLQSGGVVTDARITDSEPMESRSVSRRA